MRFVLALLVLSLNLGAQKRPITHEDVWLMKRVGAPAVSPDGKWAVVAVTEPSYDAAKTSSDLWIVPLDGSAPPRRLTSTRVPEDGAVFSPDSTRLAFTTTREGDDSAQVYVLPLSGGEAMRVTNLSTGASHPKWRPDGKAILFESRVYPGAANDQENRKIAAERKARKYNARVFEGFPFRYWDHWLDDLRPHVLVQTLEPDAAPRDLLAGTKLAALPGFDGAYSLTGPELQAVWSRKATRSSSPPWRTKTAAPTRPLPPISTGFPPPEASRQPSPPAPTASRIPRFGPTARPSMRCTGAARPKRSTACRAWR